jgi:hypothetical protein
MNTTESFQHRVVHFLHGQFPESLEMDADELFQGVSFLLEKAAHYGFITEADQVNYVITGYLLGLHFDTEMPAATDILQNPYLSGTQKADWLQQWTQQIFDALETNKPQPAEDVHAQDAHIPDMEQYLGMQTQAEPYSALAEAVIRQLMQGDASGLRTHFSPNFLRQIGAHTFEQVCAELLILFLKRLLPLASQERLPILRILLAVPGLLFTAQLPKVHLKSLLLSTWCLKMTK